MRRERPASGRMLAACEDAVKSFLPGYSNLRLVQRGSPAALYRSTDATTIPCPEALVDGERGTLALVLDLTRRLAQANPELAEPTSKAEAVVLIDEIDLHLHPKVAAADRSQTRGGVSALPVHRHDPFAAGHRRGRARPHPDHREWLGLLANTFVRGGLEPGARRDHGCAVARFPSHSAPTRKCIKLLGKMTSVEPGKC